MDDMNPNSPLDDMRATIAVFLARIRAVAATLPDPGATCFVITLARRLGCATDAMVTLSLAEARGTFATICHDVDELAFMASDVNDGCVRVICPVGQGGPEARAMDVQIHADSEHDAVFAAFAPDAADRGTAEWLINHTGSAIEQAVEQARLHGHAPEAIVVALAYGADGETGIARWYGAERVRSATENKPDHPFAPVVPLLDKVTAGHVVVVASSADQRTFAASIVPLRP